MVARGVVFLCNLPSMDRRHPPRYLVEFAREIAAIYQATVVLRREIPNRERNGDDD